MRQINVWNASPRYVGNLRKLAAKNGLSAPAGFFATPDSVLATCYNGIGPDRWTPRFRTIVTTLLERYEEDALIHDWEYTFQPKTYLHFTLANLRFAANASVNAHARYGFSRRGIADALLGFLLALLCQTGGWRGYKSTTSAPVSTHCNEVQS